MDPARNAVPDEATALNVGMAILEAYWGGELFRSGLPYKAVLHGDQWLIVSGKFGPETKGGGPPEMALSKKDGRALRILLGR
jgi:hypothetical protein